MDKQECILSLLEELDSELVLEICGGYTQNLTSGIIIGILGLLIFTMIVFMVNH